MNELVSVIIPAYNAEKFIAETIQSVLAQTWEPVEIIVVNDGSTDKTEDVILNQFTGKNIRYFYQPNGGSPAAKNLGLENAKGDYIQFLDADDLLSTDKIEIQMKALLAQPHKVAVCRTRYFQQADKIPLLTETSEIDTGFLYSTDNAFEFLLNLYGASGKFGMVQPNAYLVSRELIDKAGSWSVALSKSPDDDSEFFCRILLSSTGIIYTPQGINYYRRLNDNLSLSKQKQIDYAKGALKTIELKTQHLLKVRPATAVKQVMAMHFANFIYQNFSSYPILAAQAENFITELGFKKIPRCGGAQFRLLSNLIGVKNALILKKRLSGQ